MSVTIEDLLHRALKYLDLVEPRTLEDRDRIVFAKDRVLDALDRLAAVSAPSEPVQDKPKTGSCPWCDAGFWAESHPCEYQETRPVQDQPRVWAMPEIPEDVTRLRDNVGHVWQLVRIVPGGGWRCITDLGAYYRVMPTHDLLRQRGPVTEVVERDGD
jgi:hypothetical protein